MKTLILVIAVLALGIVAAAVLISPSPPAVNASDSPWTNLGTIDGVRVFRRCDSHVTVYIADYGSNGVSISTVPPPGSGLAQDTPCR